MKHFDFKALSGPYYSKRLRDIGLAEYSLAAFKTKPALTLKLAELLYPSKKWRLIQSPYNWVVVDYKQTLVFDPVGHETFSPNESLNLAMFGNLITRELLKKREGLVER